MIASLNCTGEPNLSKCVSWATMKTLTLLFVFLPNDFIDHGQITQKVKEQVFILAYDTHFDKLSSPVKFHSAILYGGACVEDYNTPTCAGFWACVVCKMYGL